MLFSSAPRRFIPAIIPALLNKKPSILYINIKINELTDHKPTNHRLFTSMTRAPNQNSITMDGAGDRKILTADYEEIVQAQDNENVLIIDVREQSEINETGKLPGSVHIPMGDVANLLTTLSDEAFEDKFEKPKPSKDTKIILSCRSGMRSKKVQEQMQQLGFKNVYNYTGGWLDWESRQTV